MEERIKKPETCQLSNKQVLSRGNGKIMHQTATATIRDSGLGVPFACYQMRSDYRRTGHCTDNRYDGGTCPFLSNSVVEFSKRGILTNTRPSLMFHT